MTKSRLGAFADIKAILDVAISTNGGRVELGSYAEALKWRTRAYRFRKLYAEQVPNSPYDKLAFPQPARGEAFININTHKQDAVFVPKEPGFTPIVPDEELLAKAKRQLMNPSADDPSLLGDDPL